MARVFMSYDRGSARYARMLSAALKAIGVRTYSASDAVREGESVSDRIRTSMKSSDTLVVILTNQSARSRFIAFEIGAAEALGKQVIPVLLGDIDLDRLDYLVRDQFLDGRRLSLRQVASRIKALTENRY